jgi:hypothetical protein
MKNNDEYEHFTGSFGEQVMLVVWVSLLTLVSVGGILALAMSI